MQDSPAKAASLECPTMVSVNGAATVMAIIEELTHETCRLRSINSFDIGDTLAFDFTLRGAHMLNLEGKIVSSTLNGTRRSYTIVLHRSDETAVIAALDAAARFSVAHPIRDVHTDNGLTRTSARIPLDVPVHYTVLGSSAKIGRAINVSSGGIQLNSSDDIAVGSAVELRFTLPGGTHELSMQARVVAHQHESPNYNMAFFGLSQDVRSALEAFVNAHSHNA